jgi:hypothetical protein
VLRHRFIIFHFYFLFFFVIKTWHIIFLHICRRQSFDIFSLLVYFIFYSSFGLSVSLTEASFSFRSDSMRASLRNPIRRWQQTALYQVFPSLNSSRSNKMKWSQIMDSIIVWLFVHCRWTPVCCLATSDSLILFPVHRCVCHIAMLFDVSVPNYGFHPSKTVFRINGWFWYNRRFVLQPVSAYANLHVQRPVIYS